VGNSHVLLKAISAGTPQKSSKNVEIFPYIRVWFINLAHVCGVVNIALSTDFSESCECKIINFHFNLIEQNVVGTDCASDCDCIDLFHVKYLSASFGEPLAGVNAVCHWLYALFCTKIIKLYIEHLVNNITGSYYTYKSKPQ
jgi:hypothetical protein